MSITRILNDIFTQNDGIAQDVARWFGAATILVFLYLSVHNVVIAGHPFDPEAFGLGAAALLTSVGAFIYLREKSDLQPKIDQTTSE